MTNNQDPNQHPTPSSLTVDPSPSQQDTLAQGLASFGSQLQEFQEQIRASIAHVQKAMAELQAEYTVFVEGSTVRILTEHGWFPDLELPIAQVRLLAEAFDSDPEQAHEANQKLCNRFRDRLDIIENQLKNEFPNRSQILSDAFQAHRQGQYNLSVAVFLTQVDGLFYDRFVKNLFYGPDRKDIAETIEQLPNELVRSLSRALLYDRLPLVASRNQRHDQPDGFSQLNRHQVLHGEVTNYGTEENSLKAISLLNYCASVLTKAD